MARLGLRLLQPYSISPTLALALSIDIEVQQNERPTYINIAFDKISNVVVPCLMGDDWGVLRALP